MLYEFGIVFFMTLLLIWMIRYKAVSLGLIDRPNERSSHQHPIPRGAGIALYLSVLSDFLVFHPHFVFQYSEIIFAIFLVFLVGVWDDYRSTPPKIKFIVLFIAVLLLYFDGIVINDVGTLLGIEIYLVWFALPFTIFAVSGLTNAFNLIDGIDGLAATLSMIILGGFFMIGYQHHDVLMILMSSTFFVALFAFMLFNWHPASIFMGDSGSLTLGFVISILSIKSFAYVSPLSLLFMVAVPLFDTLIVMHRRRLTGVSLFTADNTHSHHILKTFFHNNIPKTVLVLAFVQLVYTLLALNIPKETDTGLLLFLFSLNTILWYKVLNKVKAKSLH